MLVEYSDSRNKRWQSFYAVYGLFLWGSSVAGIGVVAVAGRVVSFEEVPKEGVRVADHVESELSVLHGGGLWKLY